MHDQTIAFRRDLSRRDRAAAEVLWRLAAELRANVTSIAAGGALVACRRATPDQYRRVLESAAARLVAIEASLADIDITPRTVLRELAAAVRDLRRTVARGIEPRGVDDSLTIRLVDMHVAIREATRWLWALELRLEGQPLCAAAQSTFDEVFTLDARRSRRLATPTAPVGRPLG